MSVTDEEANMVQGGSAASGEAAPDEADRGRAKDGARDWRWRRRLRSNPATAKMYRTAVAAVGAVIIAGGLFLVPLPGPGWLIVFAGIAIWASEFDWAARLLKWVRAKVEASNDYMQQQPLWVRALAGLALAIFVIALFWVVLKISGVPSFLPDGIEAFLHDSAFL